LRFPEKEDRKEEDDGDVLVSTGEVVMLCICVCLLRVCVKTFQLYCDE